MKGARKRISPVVKDVSSGPSGEFESVVAGAREALSLATSAHSATWHMDRATRYDVDLQRGSLVWSFDDGTRAEAQIQVVGTYNSCDRTFMWAWRHPSIPADLAKHASEVRRLGEEMGEPRLTSAKIAASEDEAWSFAALAMRLGNASGAYRCGGEQGGPQVYMTFGNISLSRPSASKEQVDTSSQLSQSPGKVVAQAEAEEALALVKAWRAKVVVIDKAWDAERRKRKRTGTDGDDSSLTALDTAIAAKMTHYDRIWRRDDDYWKPCSVSGNPDEAHDDPESWNVTRLDDGTYRVAYMDILIPGMARERAYLVRRFKDGLRIIDHLIE